MEAPNLLENYGWPFAETIASCVKQFFNSDTVSNEQKATCLDLAVFAAHRQNRFRAMTTCINLITSISENDLAERVRPRLMEHSDTFVRNIEPVNCKNPIIAQTLHDISKS